MLMSVCFYVMFDLCWFITEAENICFLDQTVCLRHFLVMHEYALILFLYCMWYNVYRSYIA